MFVLLSKCGFSIWGSLIWFFWTVSFGLSFYFSFFWCDNQLSIACLFQTLVVIPSREKVICLFILQGKFIVFCLLWRDHLSELYVLIVIPFQLLSGDKSRQKIITSQFFVRSPIRVRPYNLGFPHLVFLEFRLKVVCLYISEYFVFYFLLNFL